jgi:hypothetical protein
MVRNRLFPVGKTYHSRRKIMKHFWKWLGLAACGAGLLVATDRVRHVTAAEEGMSYERGGDLGAKVDRLADKLDQLLGRMGRGGPPHDGPGRRGPPERASEREWGEREHGSMQGGRPERGGPRGGMPPEMRERLEQARGAMQERMEKARERFQQLEDRVKSLEAEVERLKTSRQS